MSTIELKISASDPVELRDTFARTYETFFAQPMIDAAIAAAETAHVAAEKPKAAKPKEVKKEEPRALPEPAVAEESAVASPEPTPAADTKVEYAQVSAAVLDVVAKKGRDAALAVLAEFGVDNAKKLTEGQWAGALAALQAKLGE